MLTISTEQVDNLSGVFCEHMGIPDNTWGSVLEFSAYIGFWAINCLKSQVRHGGVLPMTPHAARLIGQLTGPHARTMVLAYKCRRYSLWGRVKTFYIKVAHATLFILIIPVGLTMEILNIGNK